MILGLAYGVKVANRTVLLLDIAAHKKGEENIQRCPGGLPILELVLANTQSPLRSCFSCHILSVCKAGSQVESSVLLPHLKLIIPIITPIATAATVTSTVTKANVCWVPSKCRHSGSALYVIISFNPKTRPVKHRFHYDKDSGN